MSIRCAAVLRRLAFGLLLPACGVLAQTSGDSNVGQQLFTATLSPACAGCHSTTAGTADARSLTSIRAAITNRATPAGAAGTMSFAKALEALDRALTGISLGNQPTGMNGLYTLTATQRGDLAAYLAGISAPAPVISYTPAAGAIFPATAVGASASATVTVSNTGTAPLTFLTNNAVTIASGGDSADFRVTASTCPGVTLQPNSGNCSVNVTFAPTAGTSLTRTASVGLATTATTRLVPLQGTVTAAAQPPAGGGGSAANPPTGGGGGVTPWLALAVLCGALAVRRRMNLQTAAASPAFYVARGAVPRRS